MSYRLLDKEGKAMQHTITAIKLFENLEAYRSLSEVYGNLGF